MYNLEKEVLSDIRNTLGQAKYLIEECIGSASAIISKDDEAAIYGAVDNAPFHDEAIVDVKPIEAFQELLRLRDIWRGAYIPDWKDVI